MASQHTNKKPTLADAVADLQRKKAMPPLAPLPSVDLLDRPNKSKNLGGGRMQYFPHLTPTRSDLGLSRSSRARALPDCKLRFSACERCNLSEIKRLKSTPAFATALYSPPPRILVFGFGSERHSQECTRPLRTTSSSSSSSSPRPPTPPRPQGAATCVCRSCGPGPRTTRWASPSPPGTTPSPVRRSRPGWTTAGCPPRSPCSAPTARNCELIVRALCQRNSQSVLFFVRFSKVSVVRAALDGLCGLCVQAPQCPATAPPRPCPTSTPPPPCPTSAQPPPCTTPTPAATESDATKDAANMR